MKKLFFIAFSALAVSAFLGYRYKNPDPEPLTPGCYISCFNADVREQFRQEANTMAFAALHPVPLYYRLQNPTGKTVSFKAADGTDAWGYEIRSSKKSDKWVFVIQEWWGLNDYIKRESEVLSRELKDANVIALDLYDGKVAATPDSAMKLVRAAKTERLESIIKGRPCTCRRRCKNIYHRLVLRRDVEPAVSAAGRQAGRRLRDVLWPPRNQPRKTEDPELRCDRLLRQQRPKPFARNGQQV